ncbi:MAG TPA: hypothetical protein VML36_09285, partial [Nitrospiria bacterium]|nr:hypothetical protein [Nitrospiria bacterium]
VRDTFWVEGAKGSAPAYLVLISTARQLTCEDLLELIETTGNYGAKVHIALESWQIVVEVAEECHRRVREAIWHLGHYCIGYFERINRIPTFLVEPDGDERILSDVVPEENGRRRLRWAQESVIRLNG